MSTLTSLISAGGGGGGTPVNTIAQLSVGGQTLYEEPSGGVWLKTGNILTSGLASYPDAKVKKRPIMSSITYDGVSGSVGSSQGSEFSPDGTRFFNSETTGQTIRQYNLSTPWDLSTIANSGISFSLSSFGAGVKVFTFSPDGYYLYVGSKSTSTIGIAILSTPFDLTGATYVSRGSSVASGQFGFSASMGTFSHIKSSSCGNYLYIGTSSNNLLQVRILNQSAYQDDLYQYYIEKYLGLGSQYSPHLIDTTGESIIVRSDRTAKLELYGMSSFDISTVRYTRQDKTFTQNSSPFMSYNSDMTKIFALDGFNATTIRQYSVSTENYIGIPGSTNPNEYVKIK